MGSEKGVTKIQDHIRFSTDILSRLGEELNPNVDQGVIELVKNAYDADATNCTVEIIDTDERGGSIKIIDDGVGMTLTEIRNGWLVLGRSSKSQTGRTKLGRIPAGNKGLGRLAALRLGQTTTLRTRALGKDSTAYCIEIDWSRFSKASVVEEVDFEIQQVSKPVSSGTSIEIHALRSRISRMDVKRLARALLLLADPFGEAPESFKPMLIAPEFADLEALVKNRYFDDAEYHLMAAVDEHGMASAQVVDWKGHSLYKATHSELAESRHKGPYGCPKAEFDLWAFLLTKEAFTGRTTTLAEIKEWLGTFGGVHLYENNLRVSPYGNPGNDWLDMNLRRAQSPEERPSTNNSIGKVSVDNLDSDLVQKTDRSGFIESESFEELRSFAKDSLDWMARCRLRDAENRRSKAKRQAPKQKNRKRAKLESTFERAPEEIKDELKSAFSSYERSHKRQVEHLQREIQLYRTLSTAGITAATFAHESTGNSIKIITLSAKTIQRRSRSLLADQYENEFGPSIDAIFSAVEGLSVLGSATLELLDWSKRRVGKVTVNSVIADTLDMFKPFLEDRKVEVKLDLAGGEPYFRGSQAALESVLVNLINNSLTAFIRANTTNRMIQIQTSFLDDHICLSFQDNGPGIDGISLKDIWLPGQTTVPNGTGLGLTIVRDTVGDLGGTVSAASKSELGGAEFSITIPAIGV